MGGESEKPVWTLAFASFFFAAGAAGGLACPSFPAKAGIVAAVLGLAFAWAALRRRAFRFATVGVLFACLSAGAARTWTEEAHYRAQQAWFPGGAQGTFTIRVDSEPDRVFDRTAGGHETGFENGGYAPQVVRLKMTGRLLAFEGHPVPALPARVTIRVGAAGGTAIAYGDVLRVRGELSIPRGARNPGGFDDAAYLKAKAVPFSFRSDRDGWTILERGRGSPWMGASLRFRRSLEEKATALWPYPANALWVGLLLGGDQTLPDDVVQDFSVTGTVHILAVSGANTALVTGLLFLLLRALGLGRKSASAWALAGLGSFVLMTGAPPSVCRAGLWGALVLLSLMVERRPRWGTLALFSAAMLVFQNPFTLGDLSFQLSYLAALSLLAFTPWWMERLRGLWRPLSVTLAATLTAQMGVWVIMAARFNLFSPYALAANLAVAPLVAFATLSGLLAVAVSFLHAGAGTLFAATARLPLDLLPWTAKWIASWRGSSIVVGTPPLVFLAAFHVLLGASWLTAWPREKPERPSGAWSLGEAARRRGARGLFVAWGVFFAAAISAWVWDAVRAHPFRATFLDVGHGNAVVLEDARGSVMVVDGGADRDGPDRWNPVVAYLRHQGRRRVEVVAASHADADHVGGLAAVVRCFPTARAVEPEGAASDSRAYRRFEEALEAKRVPLRKLTRGDEVPWGTGVRVEILHPPRGFRSRSKDGNNRSLTLKVTVGPPERRRALLLPGDLEREGWDEVLASRGAAGPWEVLLAAHHGRASGEVERVRSALHPAWVVLSDGIDHPEAASGEAALGRVVETFREGAVWVEVDDAGKERVFSFLGGALGNEVETEAKAP